MEDKQIMQNIKKIIIKFAIVFFIVMLVLLFFSKTVETMLKPMVTTCKPETKAIRDTYEFKALVNYENTKKAYPEFDYFIDEVLIEENQYIEQGMPIAKLRDIDVKKGRNELEQAISNIETNIYNIERLLYQSEDQEDIAHKEKQLEIERKNLESKQKELELHLDIIDENNNIYSPVDAERIKRELEQAVFALETNIYNIEKSLYQIETQEDRAQKEKQLEIERQNLEIKQEELELYLSIIDEGNNLLSRVDGMAVNIMFADQNYTNITTPMFEYIDETIDAAIIWDMSADNRKKYNMESELRLDYIYYEDNGEGSTIEKNGIAELSIDNIKYNIENGKYTYTVLLNTQKYEDIIASPNINVTISTDPTMLENAIPISTIHDDLEEDGKIIYVVREDIHTKELIVRKIPIIIKEKYGMYASVDYSFSYNESIVLTTSKDLNHNMKVRLR